MRFCPKCGSLLKTKTVKNKIVLSCACGYSSNAENTTLKEEVKHDEKKIEVIDSEIETHPLINIDCPKCGHKKAYYWLQQTRAGDEPETKFHRCEKCKHTWRDYS